MLLLRCSDNPKLLNPLCTTRRSKTTPYHTRFTHCEPGTLRPRAGRNG
jgi:hypothetical protein